MNTEENVILEREDEEYQEDNEGLYIALSPDGKIKRYLNVGDREIPLCDTTIAEELIQLTERDFSYLASVIITLYESWEHVYYEPNGFRNYEKYMAQVLAEMESADTLSGTLRRTMLRDMEDDAIIHDWEGIFHLKATIRKLHTPIRAQRTLLHVLDELCEKNPVDPTRFEIDLRKHRVTQVLTLNAELTSEYWFRTEEAYYIFLMQHYIVSKSNIARCQFCNRFFFPKTRKTTKYCDRVIKNGKTCKQIAPRLKRNEWAAEDRVIGEFDRIRKMQYSRVSRTGPDKKPSIVDLTLLDYWAWLSKATDALASYLLGEISEEDALTIIHVPRKDEMNKTISVE